MIKKYRFFYDIISLVGFMLKEQKVIEYYKLCNKLKDVVRTGWLDWKVNRKRVESIAEHIYGTQMLAIAMNSEYEYDIDITKVIYMLAIHELGEIIIGDLTEFQISKEDKKREEHEAVHKILSPLLDSKEIEDLFLEFDEHLTNEAKFAYQCDKLECDIQCKLYDQEGCVDLNNQEGNNTVDNETVKELLDKEKTWSDMWIEYDQEKCNYYENFLLVSKYIKDNSI